MPVLEAMAAGVPVACSDIPPLREVAGDCAIYFDPLNEDSIEAALRRLANETIATDVGQKRAAQFTWERTARATLDYLSKSSS
jgi:glycosyltransferase involved in cell wall biosynthesis